MLYLLGPISAVAARTRTVIAERPAATGQPTPVASDDVAWLQLELAGGGRGTLEASKVVPGAADDLRIEAYGSHGSLLFDTRDPNNLFIAEGAGAAPGGQRIAMFSRTLLPAAAIPGPETSSGWLQWHLAAIAAFFDALGSGVRPHSDLDSAAQVQYVIDAALRSAAQGGAQVELPASVKRET